MGHRRYGSRAGASLLQAVELQANDANDHRRKATQARERAADLERAVSWCRGRIKFLETRLSDIEKELAKP